MSKINQSLYSELDGDFVNPTADVDGIEPDSSDVDFNALAELSATDDAYRYMVQIQLASYK